MVSSRQQATQWPTCAVIVVVLVVFGLFGGCQSPQPCCDPAMPSRELSWRTGQTPGRVAPCRQEIPAGVVLEDGLSEDEAVRIALSNNSVFQATLAQLGMAHGDALQASLLMNPQFLVYFPTGTKEGQYTLFAPIESYLLRPTRVKVANREYRRIGETLVQNGLEVDRLNAKAATGVQQQSVAIAEARLATLIGLTQLQSPLVPLPLQSPAIEMLDEPTLIVRRPSLVGLTTTRRNGVSRRHPNDHAFRDGCSCGLMASSMFAVIQADPEAACDSICQSSTAMKVVW